MKQWILIFSVAGILLLTATTFGSGPEIINRDGKVSINADAVPLGEFLGLWDRATGMQSSVPPELTGYKITVHFADLSISDAVRTMFSGQPFGYGLMEGRGIVVTAPARGISEPRAESEPVEIDSNVPESVESSGFPQTQRMKPQLAPPEPVVVPTPFGPVVSPDGYQPPMLQLPPVAAPPPPPFFQPEAPPVPPAGAPNGPAENTLFGPLSIHK
ncbi:MAG TPA: hypothetical protein VGK48_22845 [Terriglobia bacterium]|jgi:hypothetical protein